MTKHQICLSSSQNFYEGLSRAFRDPLLTAISADLDGIRFLFPWQITLAACLKKLCEGRIEFEMVWNTRRSSQNEVAAFASRVGLIDDSKGEGDAFYFNSENYSHLIAIERADDEMVADSLRRLLHKAPALSRPMASAMTELSDNVFYHSGPVEDAGWGYVQAQASSSRFRIAFCDLGVGHYKTYQRSRFLNGRSPVEILENSLCAEESGATRHDRNRGLGLARVCDIVDKHKGTMEIFSDGLRCRYSQGKKSTKILGFRTKGTLISIEIPIRT